MDSTNTAQEKYTAVRHNCFLCDYGSNRRPPAEATLFANVCTRLNLYTHSLKQFQVRLPLLDHFFDHRLEMRSLRLQGLYFKVFKLFSREEIVSSGDTCALCCKYSASNLAIAGAESGSSTSNCSEKVVPF